MNFVKYDIDISDKILSINDFSVDKKFRGNGYGSQILTTFCEDWKDLPILLVAGLKTDEFSVEPDNDTYFKYLSLLENFYTKVGFVNINSFIGQYEKKISFLYSKGIGENIIKNLEGIL